LDGTVFTADRTFDMHLGEIPSTRRGDLTAFNRVVRDDFRQALSIESGATPALRSSSLQSSKADELYSSGTDAIDSGKYAQAVKLLKRVVEIEPAHGKAWTNLGRAYMGLNQTNDAIEAFRKQIVINPYDLYAYSNLGAAYVTQQKLTDAEAAFRKQLEINPLDEYSHEQLGRLYLDQHQYKEAVSELEKAASQSPRKADAHLRLGESYLNLGQHDRALVAFKRAVELDPNPWTWNNVAYQLALNKSDMELAQRYAESAVAAMDAASRTVSIEHVTERDLWQIRAMASYWDTLGWVHFVNGDRERAERFVKSSWLLVQSPEVGDHLAQIYEKQGRRDDAIQAYAEALNAEHPSPTIRERLAALVGEDDRVDGIIKKYRHALSDARSVVVSSNGARGNADFFVLFGAGASATPEVAVFIGGDEKLRAMADALRTAKYDMSFPDQTPAKILRRGTLSCPAEDSVGKCRFTLMLPADATVAEQE
jgi:tetratricopeptide (TPR) repeat protein